MASDADSVKALHRELADEFFYFADKKNWGAMLAYNFYWRTRGPAFAACAANLPGPKYLISTDDPAELTALVPKAFMFADHVLIRHRKLMPIGGGIHVASVPDDFARFEPLHWFERRRARGDESGLATLPHFRGIPEDVRGFIEWLCGPGRSWLRTGSVSYVPNLIPQEVETGLLLEECNLTSALRDAHVFPQATALLNE